MRFNTAGYMCSNQTRVVFNPSVGTYIFLFRNVTVRDPWHNSYQYLVLGYPRGALLREHSEYLGSLKRPPLQPLTTPTREEGIFAALRRAAPKPKAREDRKNAWILASKRRLANKRVYAQQDP